MTRVVRISHCLLSALFRRPTLSPAHHLRAQISHLHCPRHMRRRTDIQGSNGGSGSTATGGRRACAFAYVAHPPASALVWGRRGGLSCADCWALCVELALVREPHQSGRVARRRWGREEAAGDGGEPHPSI